MTKKGTPKKPPAAKKSKAQQLKIPGTERKSIKEIDHAAESYREVRDQRMSLTKDEVQKQKDLLDVLKKHGVTEYVYEDGEGEELVVKVDDITKVKVKKLRADEPSDD